VAKNQGTKNPVIAYSVKANGVNGKVITGQAARDIYASVTATPVGKTYPQIRQRLLTLAGGNAQNFARAKSYTASRLVDGKETHRAIIPATSIIGHLSDSLTLAEVQTLRAAVEWPVQPEGNSGGGGKAPQTLDDFLGA